MPGSLYALMKRAFIEAPCFVLISLRTASSVLIRLYFVSESLVPRSFIFVSSRGELHIPIMLGHWAREHIGYIWLAVIILLHFRIYVIAEDKDCWVSFQQLICHIGVHGRGDNAYVTPIWLSVLSRRPSLFIDIDASPLSNYEAFVSGHSFGNQSKWLTLSVFYDWDT